MKTIRLVILVIIGTYFAGCDGGSDGSLPPIPGDPPTSESPGLDLRGVVSIPRAMAISDDPIEFSCSMEYPADRNVFTHPFGLTNLRTACENCEASGQECWVRDTSPGPGITWAQMCLRPGMTLLEAHMNTTILCDQFTEGDARENCKNRATAHPPFRIRRDTPVCVPQNAGYKPGDVYFEYKKCGIAGVPAPGNMCCAGECTQGTPDTTGGEGCICTL